MFTEIHATDVRVLDDFARGTLRQHAAITDDAGVVAYAQCFAHVVVGDEHAHATIFQETNDASVSYTHLTLPTNREV